MPPHGSGSEYDSVRSNYGSSRSSSTTIGVNNSNTKEPSRSSKAASPSKPKSKYVLSGQLRGVMWLLLTEFIASVMALITRYMETLPNKTLHPMTVISWRMTISVAICLAVGYWNKTPHFPLGPKKLRPFLLLRGVGGFVGVVGFYFALSTLPLPDATVISFLVPTLVGIACAVTPGIREPFTYLERMSAMAEFVGVVVIARPSFLFPPLGGEDGDRGAVSECDRLIAVAFALLGVFGSSTAYTCLRWLGKKSDTVFPVVYFLGVGAVASMVFLVVVPGLPGILLPADRLEWTCTLALGLSGLPMQWALTKGMQLAKGSIGSQIIASQIVFALFWEMAVWGDLPAGSSLVGILLIVGGLTAVNACKAGEVQPPKEETEPDEESGLLAECGNT